MTASKVSIILGLIVTVAVVVGLLISFGSMGRVSNPLQVSSSDPVLVGAGDIASCSSTGDEATAALLDTIEGTVFTLGDNVYWQGKLSRYQECYEPSWGRHKDRTRPAIGGHDYPDEEPTGYWEYFGEAAGEPDKGYYSYDLGAWHIVVLNSICHQVDGGCEADAPQVQWLRDDLAAHPARCTLAYFHNPRFSSGEKHGGSKNRTEAFWDVLYEAGVDVVLGADEHHYERFAPQDPSGEADPERGIRQFVVGTGGNGLYPFGAPTANSEVRYNDSYGVLKLTLHLTSYSWEFIPVEGATFTDSGTESCR